jgi:hypothetical protein
VEYLKHRFVVMHNKENNTATVDLRITFEPQVSSVEYVGWGSQSPPANSGAAKDYYWAYAWFPLSIQVYPPLEPPMGAAEMMRQGQGCRDPLNGSELRFALSPGTYYVFVTLYDSQREGKYAALSVSFNGHDLGTFKRGKSEGWTTWDVKLSEDQFANASVQILRFVRTGDDAIAVRQVRISSKNRPDDPPSPTGGLTRTGWNLYARRYMYTPTFQVIPMAEAASYAVTVRKDDGVIVGQRWSNTPNVDLNGVWERLLTEHRYQAQLEALDARDRVIGRTEAFDFYVVAPFRGGYRPARCGYIESGNQCAEYVISSLKAWENLGDNAVDEGLELLKALHYPAIKGAAYINLLVTYAQAEPQSDKAHRSLRIAKAIGHALINTRTPGDWPYPNMPLSHTYQITRYGDPSDVWPLQIPRSAMVGSAFLAIAAATGDPVFRDAAMQIAATLQRTQLTDGHWHWRVNPKTDRILEEYSSDQVAQILFLDQLIRDHGGKDLIAIRNRAVQWMFANPVTTHRWEAQWDDVEPCPDYMNLEWYDAGLFILYLLRHATPVNDYLGIAKDLFHFIEDQFVFWENGYDASFITPGVQEQYVCYVTIDWHASHYIRLCQAMHEFTGEAIYLQKARAMADTLTVIQHPDGYYPTWMRQNPVKGRGTLGEIPYINVWQNCMSYTAETLIRLGRYLQTGKRL